MTNSTYQMSQPRCECRNSPHGRTINACCEIHGLKVTYLVTLDQPHGFYYLMPSKVRWTSEHEDAVAFRTFEEAMLEASHHAGASTLCSAHTEPNWADIDDQAGAAEWLRNHEQGA
jgi:hypothetical protein